MPVSSPSPSVSPVASQEFVRTALSSLNTSSDWRILFLLMSLVVVFSVVFFLPQGLRLDEAQSLWQSSHSFPGMLHLVAEDVHVPLYHSALHFWQTLWGNGVATARALSLLFFLLTIPAIYILGRRSYGRSIALFACALAAASPFLNWYGNEIRMYSLLTLLTVLNQYAFLKILREGNASGAWWLYAFTVLSGSLTHYFFLLGLLAQAAFFIFRRDLFSVQTRKNFIWIGVVVTLLLGSWLFYKLSLGQEVNTRPHLDPPTVINLFNTFSQFVFGFTGDRLNTAILSFWPLTVLLAFLSLNKTRFLPETFYFLLVVSIPILTAFLVSIFISPLYLSRYFVFTVPSLYLILAKIISSYPFFLRRSAILLLLLASFSMLVLQGVNASTPVKEDFRGAANYLTASARPQDVIVVSAPFTIYPVEYYYRGVADIETLPRWDRFVRGPIPGFSTQALHGEVNAIDGSHERVWLLLSYDQGYEKALKLYFDSHYAMLEQKSFSPGINLYLYRLRYDNPDEIAQRILTQK